ncbi:hypothetical protein V5N11_031877 [Cardamine amara subsp. amara]|uniref:DC1 domain-containing protein n=1 Tax=Cardamine amara subsp. amara TaxID=228776 RepID=A0ABD1A903_CARAN
MNSVTRQKSDNQVTFFGEPAINSDDNLSNHQTFFLCPTARIKSAIKNFSPHEKLHFHGLPYLELDSSPHFHGLTQQKNEERKICQACVIPIYEGDFYSCMECDFILHDTCQMLRAGNNMLYVLIH